MIQPGVVVEVTPPRQEGPANGALGALIIDKQGFAEATRQPMSCRSPIPEKHPSDTISIHFGNISAYTLSCIISPKAVEHEALCLTLTPTMQISQQSRSIVPL